MTSSFNYYNADFDIFGQGGSDYTIVSDFNRGNYFGDTRRRSNRYQILETYYFAPFNFGGKHSLKKQVSSLTVRRFQIYLISARIIFRRLDFSLAQIVNFHKSRKNPLFIYRSRNFSSG